MKYHYIQYNTLNSYETYIMWFICFIFTFRHPILYYGFSYLVAQLMKTIVMGFRLMDLWCIMWNLDGYASAKPHIFNT